MASLFPQRLTWRSATMITCEGVLIAGAISAGVQLRIGPEAWNSPTLATRIMLMTLVCQICLYGRDLYDFRAFDATSDMLVRVLQATAATAVVFATVYLLVPQWMIGAGVFVTGGLFVVALVMTWRLSFEWVSRRMAPRERLLLLGGSASAVELVADLRTRTDRAVDVVGVIPHDAGVIDDTLDVLGTLEDIPAIVRARGVDRVVVNLPDARGKLPMDKLLEMRLDGVRFDHLATVYEEFTGRIAVENLRPSWLIFSQGFRKSRAHLALKRASDIGASAIAVMLLLPVAAAVALAVRLTSPGPILYRQRRVGQHGRVFTLRKFRSMRQDAEAATGAVWASRNDARVTPIGRFLRRTRLDELPQLWNVLTGEMSMVGPRPERPEFVADLTRQIPFYGERHSVKPGLTGWAQVRYQYGASVEDSLKKLQYDLFYIKNLSLTLDLFIIAETVKAVVMRPGS